MARVSSLSTWGLIGLGLLLGLLTSCSGDSGDSPEDQIRAVLDTAELAVENRSLSDSIVLIAATYTDAAGRDRQAMKRMLMGYFLRHKTIHVLKQIQEIALLSESSARVILYAGVAGQRPEGRESLAGWRGDLIRLEAHLVREAGEWRLGSASWRRASHGELL